MAQTVNITATGAWSHTLPSRGTISNLSADIAAAAGAAGTTSAGAGGAAGLGGRVVSTFPSVASGDAFTGTVGAVGTVTTGGSPGGGNGGIDSSTSRNGGGGGGYTSLVYNGTTYMVAGAGGGGGSGGNFTADIGGAGGAGGGTTGGAGAVGQSAGTGQGNGGGGGSSGAGGAAGTGSAGVDGAIGTFGNGGNGGTPAANNAGGGGGGSGWWGGGGGESGWTGSQRGGGGGGGGGSSAVNAALTATTTHTQGFRAGNGYVTLTYNVLVSYTGTGTAAGTGSGSYVDVLSRSYTGSGTATGTGSGSYVIVPSRSYTGIGTGAGTGSGSYTHVPLHDYTGSGTASGLGAGTYARFAEDAFTGSGTAAGLGAGTFAVVHTHYTGSGIATGLGTAVLFGFTTTAVEGAYMPGHDRTLILEISRSDALDEDQDWVNASQYLLGKTSEVGGSLTFQSGIDPDTGDFTPGTLSLWVDNTDGAFDTHNAQSPLRQCLQARRQIRLRSHKGQPGTIVDDLYEDVYTDVYSGSGRAINDADVTTHFRGFIKRWPRSYDPGNTWSWVQLNATDGSLILQQSSLSDVFFTLDDDTFGLLDGEGLLAVAANQAVDDADPSTHRLSGDLVTLILDAATWPQDLRDLDAGRILVGEGSTDGSSLQSLADVGESEQGHFFFWPDGTAAWYDRLSEWLKDRSATPQARFGGPIGVPFTDIDGVGPDDREITSTWRRTGLSGMEQMRQHEDAKVRWGRITDGPLTISTVRDVDIVSQLDYLEARHGTRTEQISELTVSGVLPDPGTGLPLTDLLVDLKPFDRIEIDFTPPNLDAYPTYEGVALQLETTVTDDNWVTVMRLGPAATETLFGLDDSPLDSDAVLAP